MYVHTHIPSVHRHIVFRDVYFLEVLEMTYKKDQQNLRPGIVVGPLLLFTLY